MNKKIDKYLIEIDEVLEVFKRRLSEDSNNNPESIKENFGKIASLEGNSLITEEDFSLFESTNWEEFWVNHCYGCRKDLDLENFEASWISYSEVRKFKSFKDIGSYTSPRSNIFFCNRCILYHFERLKAYYIECEEIEYGKHHLKSCARCKNKFKIPLYLNRIKVENRYPMPPQLLSFNGCILMNSYTISYCKSCYENDYSPLPVTLVK
jgi:hypothetical protein